MPSDVPLQLFPAPPSKAVKPKRKGSRRKVTQPPAPAPVVERTKSPTSLEEIVIHVTEEQATPAPAAADTTDVARDAPRSITPAGSLPSTMVTTSRAASPALTNHHRSEAPTRPALTKSRATSPALTNHRSEAASTLARPALVKTRATSPALTNARSTATGSATLVRSNSDVSAAAAAAGAGVVGIRSIFPRYDPAVPLAHQNYRPTQASPTNIAPQHISKEPYSPSLYSAAGSPGRPSPGHGCLSAPSALTSFPAAIVAEQHRPRFSSLEELVDLWEAANGQVTPETGKQFALKMSREGIVDPRTRSFTPTAGESFVFGPTPDQPFYDLQTLRPNDNTADDPDEGWECHIRRRDPRKGTVIPVMSMEMASPKRRAPTAGGGGGGGDGLVTHVYPKIAAMMALDGARAQMERRQQQQQQQGQQRQEQQQQEDPLSAEEAEQIRNEAVRRAARFESCTLSWDNDSQRYYLMHPGLNKGKGQRFVVLVDPGVGFDVPDARGTIRLLEASSSSSLSSATNGVTSPAMSVASTSSSSRDTLAALEFGGGGGGGSSSGGGGGGGGVGGGLNVTLLIDTAATAKLPSFYMVDICVSSLVAVAFVEGRKIRAAAAAAALRARRVNSPVPISPPPPGAASTVGIGPGAGFSAGAGAGAGCGVGMGPGTGPGAGTGIGGTATAMGIGATAPYDVEKAQPGGPPPPSSATAGGDMPKPAAPGILTMLSLAFQTIVWLLAAIFGGLARACGAKKS